jgi:heme/copper-type cytochrome/quinol oxidase subunit 1
MSDNVVMAIVLPTIALVFGWAVWVMAVNVRRSRSSKQILELHSKLLDRFSGNQDLIAFLEGESGRRYFEALESDLKDPLTRILNGVQLGVVLMLLGISLLVVRTAQTDDNMRNALLLIGVPGIALGAGFLISAAASYYLSKSWGLLNQNRRQQR